MCKIMVDAQFFLYYEFAKVFYGYNAKVSFMRGTGLTVKRELGGSPSVRMLAQAKKLALRRGVWFKTLNRVERGAIDLTVNA